MKTIVFFHQSSELYGSDKVLFNLATGLSKKNFESIVVLPNHGPLSQRLEESGIQVIFLPILKVSRATFTINGAIKFPLELLKAVYLTYKIFKTKKVDVVYTNTVAVLSGAIYSKLMGLPHVWHVHEVLLKPAIVRKLFPRIVNHFSNKVVSISGSTTQWLSSEVCELNKKITTIWNGIAPLETVSGKNKTNNLVTITLVGRINAWKGHHLLVDAVAQLIDGGLRNVEVLIVGSVFDGQNHFIDELKKHILDAKLNEYFRFIDFTENINQIWSISDIAVVPSTEPEPFGMVAIEAMNNGIPVVAADHGGLSEIVINETTGLLFEPRNSHKLAESLGRLIIDQDLRVKMGLNGKLRQKAYFSIDSQIEKVALLVDDLVKV